MKIAVLISGGGRTLKNFLDLQSEGQLPVEIRLVVSSSLKAGGLKHAEAAGGSLGGDRAEVVRFAYRLWRSDLRPVS